MRCRVEYTFERKNPTSDQMEISSRFYGIWASSIPEACIVSQGMLEENEPTLKVIKTVSVTVE